MIKTLEEIQYYEDLVGQYEVFVENYNGTEGLIYILHEITSLMNNPTYSPEMITRALIILNALIRKNTPESDYTFCSDLSQDEKESLKSILKDELEPIPN